MLTVQKAAQAGTMESGDVLITVAPAETGTGIEVSLDSLVMLQYGEAIRQTVLHVVQQNGLTDLMIRLVDRGALDYTIEARTRAALARAGIRKEGDSHD